MLHRTVVNSCVIAQFLVLLGSTAVHCEESHGLQTNKSVLQPLSLEEFNERKRLLNKYLTSQTSIRLRLPDIRGGERPSGLGVGGFAKLDELKDRKQRQELGYAIVRLHVTVADMLFREAQRISEKEEQARQDRLLAVTLSLSAAMGAGTRIDDAHLAAEISELYLWPNIDAAHESHYSYPSQEMVVKQCVSSFLLAEKHEHVLIAGELYRQMALIRGSTNTADAARFRIAQSLESLGRYEQAITTLEEISETTGMRGAKKRILIIRDKIKEMSTENANDS